jgi:hypothetical protein
MFRKYFKIAILIILLIVGGFFIFLKKESRTEKAKSKDSVALNNEEKIGIVAEKNNENTAEVKETETDKKEIPDKILINVPFTSQAPFAKWDEFHEEACEEAAIIMVKYFLDKKELTPQVAEKEIQNLIKFQIKNYGDYKDSTAKQIVQMYSDFYGQSKNGMEFKVIYDFQKDDLKKYLAKGNPIIVPAAGRLLKNPYFTPPGPLYHNLVLTGYSGNKVITNDPGTKRGKNYEYDINILYEAIHDFPGKKEDIEKGKKAMIVLE